MMRSITTLLFGLRKALSATSRAVARLAPCSPSRCASKFTHKTNVPSVQSTPIGNLETSSGSASGPSAGNDYVSDSTLASIQSTDASRDLLSSKRMMHTNSIFISTDYCEAMSAKAQTSYGSKVSPEQRHSVREEQSSGSEPLTMYLDTEYAINERGTKICRLDDTIHIGGIGYTSPVTILDNTHDNHVIVSVCKHNQEDALVKILYAQFPEHVERDRNDRWARHLSPKRIMAEAGRYRDKCVLWKYLALKEIGVQRMVDSSPHPNVIESNRVMVDEVGQAYAIEYPFFHGVLGTFVLENTYLPLDVLRSILFQMIAGLHHVHCLGIFHGDVSLDNYYFIVENDDAIRVVLANFGSSYVLAPLSGAKVDTRCASSESDSEGSLKPLNLTPEWGCSSNWSKRLDPHHTDIWSLGASMIHLCVNTFAYTGPCELIECERYAEVANDELQVSFDVLQESIYTRLMASWQLDQDENEFRNLANLLACLLNANQSHQHDSGPDKSSSLLEEAVTHPFFAPLQHSH